MSFFLYLSVMHADILGQEKNVLVLVIGRVDFDANIFSPVNHRNPRSSAF